MGDFSELPFKYFWWSVMVKMKKKRTKWFHRQKLKCLSTDSKCPNFESRLRLRASISNKRRQDFFLPNWSNYPCSVFSSSFSRDLIRSHLFFFVFFPPFDWISLICFLFLSIWSDHLRFSFFSLSQCDQIISLVSSPDS